MSEFLTPLATPAKLWIGSRGRVFKRHLQRHRQAAEMAANEARAHAEVRLAGRLWWIANFGLKVGIALR